MTAAEGPFIADEMSRWVRSRHRRDEIGNKTRSNHEVHIRSFTGHLHGETLVDDVTTLDVESWLEDGLAHLAPSSRKTYFSTINVFYRWAVAPGRGLATRNPCDDVYKLRVPRGSVRRVPTHLIAPVVTAADRRARTMILVALHLGLRPGEVAALRLEHWDRDAGLMIVHGKGAKQRSLPVRNPELVEALEDWTDGMGTAGPMWPNPTGGPLSYGHVCQLMTDVPASIGLHITPHQWRHTMAALAAKGSETRRPMPVHILREWLGHESLASTTVYTRAVAAELWECAPDGRYLPPAAAG